MSIPLVLRSLFFVVLLPGTFAFLLPVLTLRRNGWPPPRWDALGVAGIVAICIGVAILGRCVWDFASRGRGTLAPVDPPRHLVVSGLYRYVRNPMYLGVLLVLGGEALLFREEEIAEFALGFLLVVHLFVVFYEERTLERRFGDEYRSYKSAVRRWIPGRPYSQERIDSTAAGA